VEHKLSSPDNGPKLKHDIEHPAPEFGYIPLRNIDGSKWIRFGLVSDTHLACKESRLDSLHAQYDLFKREGINVVLHAGNIVDGYVPRINGGSVIETSIDGQAQFVVDNYPSRSEIVTHFITGDDHEGWWQKEGFNFGKYLQHVCETGGRADLKYIGHVEADVEVQLKGARRSTIIKVQHPGCGSSYARSYTGQKQVEAFQGGEKPAILVQGHYHVSNYMVERNVHVIGMPGFQDQTIFARKKRLRMEIGGAILEFKVNPDDGAVTRCKVEFNLFFDRGYYKPFLRSDAKLLKGHLVICK
jgi:predicted phosphodiesterase